MSQSHANPMIFSSRDVERIDCPKCGNAMRVSVVEPSDTGVELRTYSCARCETTETFLVSV